VRKFNERAKDDPKVRDELKGVERRVVIKLSDGPTYSTHLKECALSSLAVGDAPGAEITIESDKSTMLALMKKEMGPMKAMALKKIRIKADIEDIFRLRKLLSS
ncbi:SCP2 sterol-binding domain-containing protein, partial [Candidatus Uhrbacteria bacterium]|nr:SCP2 sterol-binding domain-containing protein [Candidatus Uhrbacteria bacterium]